MGQSCRRRNVFLLLAALETILKSEGHPVRPEPSMRLRRFTIRYAETAHGLKTKRQG